MSAPFRTIKWCPILGDISGFFCCFVFPLCHKKMPFDQKGGCFTLALNTVWWFRNPARTPVEVGSLSHDFFWFCTSQVVFSPDFWTINSRCFHRYDSGRMARESLSPQKKKPVSLDLFSLWGEVLWVISPTVFGAQETPAFFGVPLWPHVSSKVHCYKTWHRPTMP